MSNDQENAKDYMDNLIKQVNNNMQETLKSKFDKAANDKSLEDIAWRDFMIGCHNQWIRDMHSDGYDLEEIECIFYDLLNSDKLKNNGFPIFITLLFGRCLDKFEKELANE